MENNSLMCIRHQRVMNPWNVGRMVVCACMYLCLSMISAHRRYKHVCEFVYICIYLATTAYNQYINNVWRFRQRLNEYKTTSATITTFATSEGHSCVRKQPTGSHNSVITEPRCNDIVFTLHDAATRGWDQ